jgi:hypothetical protein
MVAALEPLYGNGRMESEAGLWVPWSREFRGVWRRVRPVGESGLGSSQDSSIFRSVLLFRIGKKKKKEKTGQQIPTGQADENLK